MKRLVESSGGEDKAQHTVSIDLATQWTMPHAHLLWNSQHDAPMADESETTMPPS